ncbi:hypothetical protein [Nocardia brasiliensis]|uniref:hypothetical protein n=1 Tax=Nocardia brasiliensis TaxID=37326 RepID=UPI002455C19C|nr:hypothetical protein [Nocardia brasiliensis]
MDMPTIFIPDRQMIANNFPDNPEYHYGENVEKFLEQLPGVFRPWYESFGKIGQAGQSAPPVPPEQQSPPMVVGDTSNIKEYPTVAQKLRELFLKLEDNGKALLPLLTQLGESNTSGRRSIESVIQFMNLKAEIAPAGMNENEYILAYVQEAIDVGTKEMERARSAAEALVRSLPKIPQVVDPGKQDPPPAKTDVEKPAIPAPPAQPPGSQVPQGTQPQGQQPTGTNSPSNIRLPQPDDPISRPNSDSGVQDKINRAIDNIENQVPRNQPQSPVTPPMSPYGSGMGMPGMGDMLGPLMQAAQMRQMADPNMNQRPPAPRRLDQSPPPPPQKAQPGTPQPAQQQTAKPTSANAQPISNVSSTPNTANGQPGAAPVKASESEGRPYTYPAPDGRQQLVSPMVYDALDVAFADKSGTDAKHAYEKTKAKWSDDKKIGTRVDPNQLMTGDVVIWDRQTALLVVFPPDQGGTVEAIVKGEKKPLSDLMAAETSEFGEFLGFAHPAGIELPASAKQDPSAAVVDPASAAPVVTTA